jgi:cobalt-zinc-cadmium resistance protein CzcA
VMSGVILIARINTLRTEFSMPLLEAVRQGAQDELRPILMMMLVALLGLIPASLATGIGSDVQRPLATVIVGGLASALILTLLVLPALYYTVERRARKDEVALAVEVQEVEGHLHEQHIREVHEREIRELHHLGEDLPQPDDHHS